MSKAHEHSTTPSIAVDEKVNPFPPIRRPVFQRPTEEELARRRQMFERAAQIREAVRAEFGPLDIPTDELKHLSRAEAER